MSLTDFHGFQNSVRWRLVQEGLEVEGTGIERTNGAPTTMTRIWEAFAGPINETASEFNLPCVLILATIATESQGHPDALRKEPGYVSDQQTPGKISPGLMQTLISTAREALHDPAIDRQWLLVPRNSIRAGAAYINRQRTQTTLDPPKVAAAYNAGSLKHQDGPRNRWKLRQFPIGTAEHCDRFVKWFNDACFVLGTHPLRPSVPYAGLLAAHAQPEPTELPRPPAPGTPPFPGELRETSRGDGVRTMQARLNMHLRGQGKLEIPLGPARFGPRTKEAVTWFQRARSLVVTGIVDETTWTSLWR